MHTALGMKDISNLSYMHCTTIASLKISDEPQILNGNLLIYSQRCIDYVKLWASRINELL